jgi:hypothetical protein
MKTKTNCKAGQTTGGGPTGSRLAANHNETLLRDNGKNLRVKTALRSGKKAA